MFSGLFQPMHLLVILAIVLVIFGPKNLPKLGSDLGRGIKELRKAVSGDEHSAQATDAKKHD